MDALLVDTLHARIVDDYCRRRDICAILSSFSQFRVGSSSIFGEEAMD
jgi:hypothetical protein